MDNILIFPPGGSPPAPSFIQLGSWLMADPGPDYGAKGLINSLESSNALYDGGAFGFRYSPPRKMALPLIINSPYGVNRVPNPGFETATYYPLNAQGFGANATVSVVGNASGALGSYIALATVGVNAGGGARFLVATMGAVASGEPLLFAARMCDFTPSSAGETAVAQLRILNAAGSNFFPDTAAPGYVFGFNAQGSPNTGSFVQMNLPKAWTSVGGILSAPGVASLLAGGLPLQAEWMFAVSPSAGALAGASYVTVGIDELEVRSAYPQRAIREQEAQLREFVGPGGYVAVQPEGVPTAEAVFFDILDGRWEPDYSIFHNRAGIRKGTLYLDTQPFGYWPTEILLASSASIGYLGQMFLTGASVIGDVAPLAHILVQPTSASTYPLGPWFTDMLAWSLSGQPSFSPLIAPGKFLFQASPPPYTPSSPFTATLTADPFAPASQAWRISASMPALVSASGAQADIPWTMLLGSSQGAIPSALEPAYRGRFRAFAFVRSAPSMAPWLTCIDAAPFQTQALQALGSANQIATFGLPAYPSWGTPGNVVPATALLTASAYVMLDLGELNLPPAASGMQQPVSLRLWAAAPSGMASAAPTYANLYFGGVFLLPVDGMSGVLPAGLAQPSVGAWNTGVVVACAVPSFLEPTSFSQVGSPATSIQAALELGGRFIDSALAVSPSNASSVLADLRALHHGIAPRLGPSTNQLVFVTGDRRAGATTPVLQANFEYAQVSVSYRPAFQFMFGL